MLLSSEPNKTMETIIQEIRKQLTNVEDGISFLKQNKTSSKGLLF